MECQASILHTTFESRMMRMPSMLQGGVAGYMQTWYELVALER